MAYRHRARNPKEARRRAYERDNLERDARIEMRNKADQALSEITGPDGFVLATTLIPDMMWGQSLTRIDHRSLSLIPIGERDEDAASLAECRQMITDAMVSDGIPHRWHNGEVRHMTDDDRRLRAPCGLVVAKSYHTKANETIEIALQTLRNRRRVAEAAE